MADVWKSNARKFCELCKVWFADNRVSIEHHESGQKHKAAIQAKLRELGKQRQEKEKAQNDLQATLAKMEAAACKSMTETGDVCPSAGLVGPVSKPKKYMNPKACGASVVEMARHLAQLKKEEMEQKRPELKTKITEGESECETVWVEALADNGIPYYFHMYSGVTVWDKPKNYYTAEQYAVKLATMENNDNAVTENRVTEPNKLESEPRRHWVKHEFPISNRSKNVQQKNTAKVSMQMASSKESLSKNQEPNNSTSKIIDKIPEAITPEQTVVKFDPETDATNFTINECDIPLPPSPQSSSQEKNTANLLIKEEPVEITKFADTIHSDQTDAAEEGSVKVKEESESLSADDKQQEKPSQKYSPYGAWVPVEKPSEPPKIDWELPTEEEGRKRISEPVVAPEDIITFGDKSAAVKKRKLAGPIEFKKRKTAMKLRQPVDNN